MEQDSTQAVICQGTRPRREQGVERLAQRSNISRIVQTRDRRVLSAPDRTRPGLLRLVIASAALLVAAAPAHAGLSVCSKSNRTILVAFGHFNGTYWASEGWRKLAPKKCSELVAGPLNARYYYLFGTDNAFTSWDGTTDFCINATGNFSDEKRGTCEARGLGRRGFFAVDTGDYLSWIYYFKDPT